MLAFEFRTINVIVLLDNMNTHARMHARTHAHTHTHFPLYIDDLSHTLKFHYLLLTFIFWHRDKFIDQWLFFNYIVWRLRSRNYFIQKFQVQNESQFVTSE